MERDAAAAVAEEGGESTPGSSLTARLSPAALRHYTLTKEEISRRLGKSAPPVRELPAGLKVHLELRKRSRSTRRWDAAPAPSCWRGCAPSWRGTAAMSRDRRQLGLPEGKRRRMREGTGGRSP